MLESNNGKQRRQMLHYSQFPATNVALIAADLSLRSSYLSSTIITLKIMFLVFVVVARQSSSARTNVSARLLHSKTA